jgi:hypothetical protein
VEPNANRKYLNARSVMLIVVIIVILIIALVSVLSNSNDSSTNENSTAQPSPQENDTTSVDSANVKDLVSYTLPDGWQESTCPSSPGSVFFEPNNSTKVDCDANPSAPVKMSVDPANTKDCAQLQNVQNVSKHICISEFINDNKTIKAETRYNNESAYERDVTVKAYYISTDDKVVKIEYIYENNDEFQLGFEQLAKSVRSK